MVTTNITNSIFTSKFKLRNALNFIEKVKDSNYRLYIFASRIQPWEYDQAVLMTWVEYFSVEGEVVAVAKDTVQQVSYEPWRDMIYAKIIGDSDVYHCIPRYDWVSNTPYAMYDDTDPDLATKNFYVLASDEGVPPVYSVYKCLYNNGGNLSTVKPTGNDTDSPIYTSDGYIWKYMLSLTATEVSNYLTESYIPIRKLEYDDGTLQWDVQQNAVDGSVPVILVTSSGYNYDTHYGTMRAGSNTSSILLDTTALTSSSACVPAPSDSDNRYVGSQLYIEAGTGAGQVSNVVYYSGSGSYTATIDPPFDTSPDSTSEYIISPLVTIDGSDGSGLSSVSVMSGNSISSIKVISSGSGYTRNQNYTGSNTVCISANGGIGAAARLIISPPGGHGSNALAELFGYNVLVKSEFNGSESNALTITNDYRQFGLLENPNEWGNAGKFSGITAQLTYNLAVTNNTGIFEPDQIVVDQTSGANGLVVDHSDGVLKLSRVTGVFDSTHVVVQSEGNNVPISATISSVSTPEMEPFTGDIIFLANREAISRSNSQIEEYHLIFTL